jgi:hypothetical protein
MASKKEAIRAQIKKQQAEIEDTIFGLKTFPDTGRKAESGAEAIDSYVGAPVRATLASMQDGEFLNALKAGWNQAGKDPNSAPTGEQIARKAGIDKLEPAAAELARPFVEPFTHGSGKAANEAYDKAAEKNKFLGKAAGLAIDSVADVPTVAGLAGKGAVGLAGVVSKASKVAPELESAQAILKAIDTPEKAVALTGDERNAYLQALDLVHGPREQRAKDMGFGKKTWFHGTGADIDAFDPELLRTNATGPTGSLGFHFSKNPGMANQYAEEVTPAWYRKEFAASNKRIEAIGDHRETLMKKYGRDWKTKATKGELSKDTALHEDFFANKDDLHEAEARLKSLPEGAEKESGNNVLPVRLKTKNATALELDGGSVSYDEAATAKMLKEEGKYNGVVFKNGHDSLSGKESIRDDVALMFNPSDIRSPHAAFDPRFKDSAKLLAGGSGATSADAAMAASNIRDHGHDRDAYMSDPKIKDLLIKASDLKPGSKAMDDIVNRINRLKGKN